MGLLLQLFVALTCIVIMTNKSIFMVIFHLDTLSLMKSLRKDFAHFPSALSGFSSPELVKDLTYSKYQSLEGTHIANICYILAKVSLYMLISRT